MKLEEIEAEWAIDTNINQNALAAEAARVPVLHAKYYKIMLRELFKLKEIDAEITVLERDKHLYYTDSLTDSELAALKWKRVDIKPLRADLEKHISADKDIINARLKRTVQDEKVSFLKSIITTLNNRGYLIQTMVAWKKFEAGD